MSFETAVQVIIEAKYPDVVSITINDREKIAAISTLRYHLRHFGEPQPYLKILTDVRCKEHTNRGAEPDTLKLGVNKKRQLCIGSGFKFSILQGIDLDDGHKIGYQIFNATGKNVDDLLVFTEDDTVRDKLIVPPYTKVVATIKTQLTKYVGEADIDIQAPANYSVKIRYSSLSCSCDCCPGWYNGTFTLRELFQMQPNFRVVGSSIFFTAKYHYTFFGENFDVDKSEQRLTV